MRTLPIAMTALRQGDRYIMQRREGAPAIGEANKVGFFGGKAEEGEAPEDTACRELREETNIVLDPGQITYLGNVRVVADYKLEETNIVASVYSADIPENFVIKALEGALVAWTADEVKAELGSLTPGTYAAFQELIFT